MSLVKKGWAVARKSNQSGIFTFFHALKALRSGRGQDCGVSGRAGPSSAARASETASRLPSWRARGARLWCLTWRDSEAPKRIGDARGWIIACEVWRVLSRCLRSAREEGRSPCCDVGLRPGGPLPRASGEASSRRVPSAAQGVGTGEQRYPPCWAYWRGALEMTERGLRRICAAGRCARGVCGHTVRLGHWSAVRSARVGLIQS
ncbi:hypothetical protein NDU88_002408 [Pleurodeles waltl]|uniref:Uncharacterized protein n=1 Tax=Pleurodeles waltl TaxID=8319 RepID=A0AAV7KVL2_PLEWA|nr:hypothetical protein NDU88_002408 [Pleurodeles waltl]